jgi:hypothetical protein
MSTSSAYPFRHPRLRVVREPVTKERHWNPLRHLRRRPVLRQCQQHHRHQQQPQPVGALRRARHRPSAGSEPPRERKSRSKRAKVLRGEWRTNIINNLLIEVEPR